MSTPYQEFLRRQSSPERTPYEEFLAQSPPEPVKPPLWERLKATGAQIAEHPLDALKGIGGSLLQNAKDAATIASGDPSAIANAAAGEAARGAGAGKRLGARVVGAAALPLPGAAELFGLKGAAGLAANVAGGATLGAAQTPDDPALGAIFGAAIPAAIKGAGAATRATGRALSPLHELNLSGVTDDVLPTRVPVKPPTPGVSPTQMPGPVTDVLDALASQMKDTPSPRQPVTRRTPLSVIFDPANEPHNLAINEKIDAGELAPFTSKGNVGRRLADDVAAAKASPYQQAIMEEAARNADQMDVGMKANAMIDNGTTAPYSTTGNVGRRTAEAHAAKLAEQQAAMEAADAAARAQVAADADAVTVPPRALVLKRAPGPFPNGFTPLEDELQPMRSAIPRPARNTSARPMAQTPPAAPLPESSAATLPEPAPVTPPAPVVEPPAPAPLPAPVDAPAAPVAPPVTAPEPAPVAAPTPEPIPTTDPMTGRPVPTPVDAVPTTPAKDVEVNWRTWGDEPTNPLGQSVQARLQAATTAADERLRTERGFASFDTQADHALKSQVIQELTDDPLSIDRTKLRHLTGAQVVAVKDVALENTRMTEMLSREIQSGTLSPEDMTLAQQKLDALQTSTNEALATVVGESARMGRDLGYLRTLSRLSTDPATWMVHAKKVLGDRPLTVEVQAKIAALADEAARACGGG